MILHTPAYCHPGIAVSRIKKLQSTQIYRIGAMSAQHGAKAVHGPSGARRRSCWPSSPIAVVLPTWSSFCRSCWPLLSSPLQLLRWCAKTPSMTALLSCTCLLPLFMRQTSVSWALLLTQSMQRSLPLHPLVLRHVLLHDIKRFALKFKPIDVSMLV